MTPKKRVTKAQARARKNITLSDIHGAAVAVEGFLRRGMSAEAVIKKMARVPPRTWVRVGLEGLVRAIKAQEE